MSIPRKKLSNVFTLLFALSSHGVVKSEDISWLRKEFAGWADTLLKKINI